MPARYLSGQYLADLLTWYHLAWTGETVRRKEECVVQLMTRGENFTHADRMRVFELIGARGAATSFRAIASSPSPGRVELSTTPHYHPIGPLLLDFGAAREALPDAPLPAADHYPGGTLAHHLASHSAQAHAIAAASKPMPRGIWPAEGAVSAPFLKLLAEHKVGVDGQRRRGARQHACAARAPAPSDRSDIPVPALSRSKPKATACIAFFATTAVRPDRIRIQGLARQRGGRAFHRAARSHPRAGAERTSRRW